MEELVIKYLAGEATAEESREVLEWSSRNEENERHFNALKKIFDLTQRHYQQEMERPMDIDIEEEWKYFQTQVSSSSGMPVVPLQSGRMSRVQWLRMAAAFLLLIAATFVIRYFVSRPGEIRLQTASETREVSLPDGSRVILNHHSELAYGNDFGETDRTIALRGEAFFDVVHNEKKPFRVQVRHAVVEDVGTSFNILGYEGQDMEVVVQSGAVRFSLPNLNAEVSLSAGQKGIYNVKSKNLTQETNEDVNFLAWSTRKIVFTDTDLRQVIETINRTYQSNIVLATNIPPSCTVTVAFDHQTLEAVLHVLETTLNLTLRKTGDKIEIIKAGC